MLELDAFGGLSRAEEAFLARFPMGEDVDLRAKPTDAPAMPDEPDDDTRIRAGLIAWAMRGGDAEHPLHERGIRISCAWIEGVLDLQGHQSGRDLRLGHCRLPERVFLRNANLGALSLSGSRLDKGLFAEGMKTRSDVFLRNGFHAIGPVRLLGADIGGNLSCTGGRFEAEDAEAALHADRIGIGGHVLLNDGCSVRGSVRLLSARIGGDLNCSTGRFAAPGAVALNLEKARIEGTVFLRAEMGLTGMLRLTGATVSRINDDPACWPEPDQLRLDNCRYGAFSGNAAQCTAAMRLDWLARQDYDDFRPQPYEQLALVFREMGHREDAREVLFVKEKLLRADRRRVASGAWRLWLGFRDWGFELVAGFGLRPFRVLRTLVVLSLLAALVFWQVWEAGQMAPDTPVVLNSPEWKAVEKMERPNIEWAQGYPGRHYETFNALAYGADVVIPILDLGQDAAWAPATTGIWGTVGWIASWVFQVLGWVVSAVLLASINSLIRPE